jgi:Asp/Glu/hydantoin racemase
MRIALIHAARLAMQPVEDAFLRHWPLPERVNLLDDSLAIDRERAGALTRALTQRIAALAEHALAFGAAGILYTCSAFGPAIGAVQRASRVPVVKPNDAMLRAALQIGRRIGVLATFPATIASVEAELRALEPQVKIQSLCVPEAMRALSAGDAAGHDKLLQRAARVLKGRDVVLLAQFSTARARDAVKKALACPVLTSPDSAVLEMRQFF